MTKELKRFEQWWDAEDDIPNDGPYTPDTPIQFAWAGWQAALAQPEQEPVAKVTSETGNPDITMSWWHEPALPIGTKLYTSPPQRPWVGLTDEERQDIALEVPIDAVSITEAKLKELNT